MGAAIRWIRRLTSVAPVLVLVALFALGPVGIALAGSASWFSSWPEFRSLVTDPANQRAIVASVVQGALSAIVAVGVGYPAGLLLGRYRWRGRDLVRALLLVPFVLPTIVVVLGVVDLFGPRGWLSGPIPALGWFGHGVPAIIAVNIYFNASLVALLTSVGVDASSSELEDTAATLGAGPARTYLDVWGPPSWTGAAAGGALTFLFSALAFAGPILLCGDRCATVEVRVWSLSQLLLAPNEAGALATLLIVLLVAPTLVYLFLLHRLRSSAGLARARRRIPWGSPASWILIASTTALVAGTLLLLGTILERSVADTGPTASAWSAAFSPRVTNALGQSIGGAMLNTLFFAGAAALITLLLGVWTAYALPRRGHLRTLLRSYLFLPLLVSPVVLAFALAAVWRPLLGGESMVWLLILLSQTLLALPFALQSMEIPLSQLDGSLSESARVLGVSGWAAFADTELGELRTGLTTASLFAFALGLGEFTATFFLVTPLFTTLPVAVYRLESLRLGGAADAIAALLTLLCLAVLIGISVGGRRVEL